MAAKPKYYVDLEERVSTLESMVLSLQEQLASRPVSASPKPSGPQPVGSNKQRRLLVELEHFESFEEATIACTPVLDDEGKIVTPAFDVNGTLDAWRKLFPYPCNYCKTSHSTAAEALACAVGSNKSVEAEATTL